MLGTVQPVGWLDRKSTQGAKLFSADNAASFRFSSTSISPDDDKSSLCETRLIVLLRYDGP